MKPFSANQIRDMFLEFFEARGHMALPSFPLVPQGDSSLLLVNSGMAPLKPWFTGAQKPPSPRVATCQKCIRTVDIEDVGKKARYGSFFEMLGNFSFGDYFKREAICWAWEFLTQALAIPEDRLLVTVYEGDDEALAVWRGEVGVPDGRIFKFGKDENYWELGTGPCGPCSEIHYDRGPDAGCHKNGCAPGCDCDRFIEIWNLVFTQFEKLEGGGYAPLESRNIDTGAGLERLALVMQGAGTIFEIDSLLGIKNEVLKLAGAEPAALPPEKRVSANIVTDHVRSVAFMAADGVLPSNEGRGYVLRRLLRRAVRHGRSLGISHFVPAVARAAIGAYSHAYPELGGKSGHILSVLAQEESRFLETLENGMAQLAKQICIVKAGGARALPAAEGFRLYDTFGFPPELTKEILAEEGLCFDEEGFGVEMERQRERARGARGASGFMGAGGGGADYGKLPSGPDMETVFLGYETEECGARVLAMLVDGEPADEAAQGQEVALVLDDTVFYAAAGGQAGDSGRIFAFGLVIEISDCVKGAGGNTVHIGKVAEGSVKAGQSVDVQIDSARRKNIRANHSATHLLQGALRETLGRHVEQAGSSVNCERLRFDFTHGAALGPDEISRIEDRVNALIMDGLPVATYDVTPDEARTMGALALFGEKYGESVRVVDIGGASLELCGGTHVENTAAIGLFRIVGSSGVAAGVRRLEAITGLAALESYRGDARLLGECCRALKTAPDRLLDRASALVAEHGELKKENARLKSGAAPTPQAMQVMETIKAIESRSETHRGFRLAAGSLGTGLGAEAMRGMGDKLKAALGPGCFLIATDSEIGDVRFLACATDDAVKAGLHAGDIVRLAASICGGGGGGKPGYAQAGGKDASRLPEAIAAAMAAMKEMLDAGGA